MMYETPHTVGRFRNIGFAVAAVGLILLAVGSFLFVGEGLTASDRFFESYLFGFFFTMLLPLGSLGWLMVQYLTGGTWALAARRLLEAGALTLPLMAILSIPVILAAYNVDGGQYLFEWANPAVISPDSPEYDRIVAHKVPWLSPLWFTGRMVIYFAIWCGLAILLRRFSLDLERTGDPQYKLRARPWAGVGIALFVITVTFAAFDWGMSLDPHWYSTIYGAVYIVCAGLVTMAFTIIVISQLVHTPLFEEFLSAKQWHDMGKLMFAFVVLWTYTNFGQYVIIWSGDIVEFTPWFIRRGENGWEWVMTFLVAFNFAFPFFVLLSRQNKRNLRVLSSIAALLIFVQFVNSVWYILPEFHESVPQITIGDIGAALGLFGLVVGVYMINLSRAPVLATKDPVLVELAHAGGH
jgi:hypothetical protein